MVYSHQEKEFKYPVIAKQKISLSHIRNLAEEGLAKPKPTIMITGGAILFNLIVQSRDVPEFLILTEIEESCDERKIAGKIENTTIQEFYEGIFLSRAFVNEFGEWRIRVLKRKGHIY
jgi:hypothetical protein